MAGDLNIYEQAVVLPAQSLAAGAEAAQAAQAALGAASGGVTHQYGKRVIIAAAPPTANAWLQAQTPGAALASSPAAIPESVKAGLDPVELLGLEAFALRSSPQYGDAKAQRPHDGEAWDSEAALEPDRGMAAAAPSGEDVAAAAPTSARLTGRVAVGLIIVEGPTNDLKFSSDERTKVVAEVQNGLSWLGSQSSPAGVSWVYDIHIVSLNTPVGPPNESDAQKEARWRDPAMAQLGYGPGLGNVQAYVENLRTALGTDWAYCGFFTKYPIYHFAYASIGGPRIVMDYNNDGWGPDNIDRVFAHESGHIFGAPDEYKDSNCDCGGTWGIFNVPNTNCENCAPGGGVPCIMKSNSWEMCAYTPYHLGFPQGQRYSGVFQSGSDRHGLWVNADWDHFTAKWGEWSNQGLRLTDLEISQPGGQLRYSGVFREGGDGYGLWALADWDHFTAKWQEWSSQGLRLVDLEITQIDGQLRYSGVFRAGSDGYGLWALADWDHFTAKWQEWSSQGLRLVDLTVTQVGNDLRYSGVFQAGSGGYGLWALADWNSFTAKWQEWSSQGLRLVDLEITKVGNDTRYSGVFQEGASAYALWAEVDWARFVEKWQEWSGQGLRLVDFDITLTGIEAAASAVAGQSASAVAGAADPGDGAGYGVLSFAGVALAAEGKGLLVMPQAGDKGDEVSAAGSGELWLPKTAGKAANGSATEHAGMGLVILPAAPKEKAKEQPKERETANGHEVSVMGFGAASPH